VPSPLNRTALPFAGAIPRYKHQAAGNRLRKLLRSPRLLACEVASIRVGLGNLSATKGEPPTAGNANAPSGAGVADVRAEGRERTSQNFEHLAADFCRKPLTILLAATQTSPKVGGVLVSPTA